MVNYSWPGNVRELSNAIESALTFGTAKVIRLTDLPAAIRGPEPREIAAKEPQDAVTEPVSSFAEAERDLIRRALESTGGNKRQAAKLLQISRKTLYAKIKQHNL
jgi:DNA-binding NtrC family response regulator